MNDALLQIVKDLDIRDGFDERVDAEVQALTANPGFDDPTLEDWTATPFVTIDNRSSRDLDQALFVRAVDGGFEVAYALADAAHFVPPGSALFEEALLRGASFYLPGASVPMLPRALSEGLVSLNPNVIRRALVFVCALDGAGEIRSTRVVRGRIRSQAKLAFEDVQDFYDEPDSSPISRAPYAESLRVLRTVGERRMHLAQSAHVVRYRRREVEVKAGAGAFVALEAVRPLVELYNEQVSLLVNREGGRLLAHSKDPRLQPIYRVHPAPDVEKLDALRALTAGVARVHGLDPDVWILKAGETLNDLLERLPQTAPTLRIARAVERQAILVNMRSAFSIEPAQHFGVGAEVYARFSAPMREIVGIFLHKEMLELLRLEPAPDSAVDVALRERVVSAANRSRDVQRKVNDRANRLVIDQLFAPDLAAQERPGHLGTVMGLSPSKVHVELDAPGLDVKVYVRDLGKMLGGKWLDLAEDGAALVTRDERAVVCAIGDRIEVRVVGHDRGQDRWIFELARMNAHPPAGRASSAS